VLSVGQNAGVGELCYLGEVHGAAGEACGGNRPVAGWKVVLTEVHRAINEGGAGEVDEAGGELGVFEADLSR
jgi:hypothetical protein